ncbi:MAG: MipA/OmpV family protein [Epsilonproteobacteria bacterium]|nr:MipA/OmpV family protein [Campylobacterota bacterium]
MRHLLAFIFLLSTLAAQKLTLGAGPYIQTQPYKGVDEIVVPSPVIFYEESIFYVRWTRFGAYFAGSKGDEFSWGASITAQPRTFGYKPGTSAELSGMQERKSSFEGGVALSLQYGTTYVEFTALTDIIARHENFLYKTTLGDQYKIADLTLYPSLLLTYQSQPFVEYYYGIKAEEAAPSRAAFTPKEGISYGAECYISYPITKSVSAFFNAKFETLPTDAANSFVTDEKLIFSGLLSLLYTLEWE